MLENQAEKILKKYPGARREKLIPILQELQLVNGYLDEESIRLVGNHLKLPSVKIYGIATFYNEFSFIPRGRYHIRICHGSACHVRGSGELIGEMEKLLGIKNTETSPDGLFSLEITSCLGACSKGPIVEVNSEFHAYSDISELRTIIQSLRKK